jgi:hypothetical protein
MCSQRCVLVLCTCAGAYIELWFLDILEEDGDGVLAWLAMVNVADTM